MLIIHNTIVRIDSTERSIVPILPDFRFPSNES